MRKGEILGKIFGIALAVLVVFSICGALPGIANVEPVSASPGIIYVPDNFTTIQQAVNNATSGDTIIVRDGTYHENVDVNTANLTIKSENGTANCVVSASSSSDHVFDVSADWVNITGFTVEGTTQCCNAGIYLDTVSHCNICSNNATNNYYSIYLYYSSSNTLKDNTANSNDKHGIRLYYSSNNTLTNNTANSNSQRGIYLYSSSNNTLANNTVSNNTDDGICVGSSSNNNTLTNNTANSNGYGIWLSSSSNNNLTNNTANSNNDYGIYLYSSSNNNTLRDNTASNNDKYGIRLSGSSDNTLTNNTMSGNSRNFVVWGSSLIQDIDTSNKVDGKPIYYWVNHQDEQVPSDAGYVAVVNSTNITVRDLTLTKNGEGVLFAYTEDSRIENVTASNNDYGIYLYSSSNNTLRDNTADSNGWGIYLYSSSNNTLSNNNADLNGWGIYLGSSHNNTFTNNTANWNNYDGIYLKFSSNNNTLANNTASNNTGGIDLGSSHNNTLRDNTASSNGWYGINLVLSSNNTFTNNIANSNPYGIWVSGSSDNTLTNNTASNNTNYGIYLDYSSNNTIYNNYFYFDNTNNAWDNGANTWNTTNTTGPNIIGGPYLGGNYWSDYTGSDTNGDGFGETPYNITGGSNKDYLPLVGTTLEGHVTFPMARVGSLVEPFAVKGFEQGNLTNELWSENTTTNNTGVFTITDIVPGAYDIFVKSWTSLSEVNITNGTLIAGATTVVDFGTIREGDIDDSDYVDMGDYSAFSTAFNTAPSDGKWNDGADLDRSGYIDMGDYSMFSTYFNELGDAWGQF